MSSNDLLYQVASTQTRLRLEEDNGRPWDIWLLIAVCTLIGFGIVMLYSASAIMATDRLGNQYYLVKAQLLKVGLGMSMLMIALRVDYRWYKRLILPIVLVAIAGLVLVLVFGVVQHGSRRWFSVFGMSFQPAEVAKIAVVMYLAYSVSVRKSKGLMKKFSTGFVPHITVVGVFVLLLMLEPDFGSSMILITMLGIFLFVSGANIFYLGGFGLAGLLGAYIAVTNSAYRMKRVHAFLDPWQYRTDIGYQISESLIAIGSGGLTGKGLGNGLGKLGYVPELWNDFIGTSVAEELGLLGIAFIVALFLFILWRGWRIATSATDDFGRFLAFGITAFFCVQGVANLYVVCGLAPTKGLTLPFVSLGGSSMILALFAVGVLLNISKNAPDQWELTREKRQAKRAEREWEKSRRESSRPRKNQSRFRRL